MPVTGTPEEGQRSDVELRLPADSAYVSVLRTTAASLAARLDFTIDDIEDLRIAVGEACALVLPDADPASPLTADFFLYPGRLTVRVTISGSELNQPDRDSFAWQVLETLAPGATSDVVSDTLSVTLSMQAETLEPSL